MYFLMSLLIFQKLNHSLYLFCISFLCKEVCLTCPIVLQAKNSVLHSVMMIYYKNRTIDNWKVHCLFQSLICLLDGEYFVTGL